MKNYSNYYPTYKEVILESGNTIFNEQLKGFEGKQVEINGKKEDALVQHHQNPLNEFKQDRRITVSSSVNLDRGNYVKTLDNNREYLILSKVNQNELTKYAMMRETNHNLKFINSNDELVVKPCIVSAKTLYTTGIEEGKEIVIPDGMFGIQVAYDEDTKEFERGDAFVFNSSRNVITFKNKVEYEGLWVLICEEKIINSNLDDAENEIANRYREDGSDRLADDTPTEPEVPGNPDEDSYTINILGNDRFVLMTEEIYTAKVLNNGVEVDDKKVVFSLNSTLAIIKSQSDNICTLETNTNFKTGKFILTARLADDDTVFSEREIIIIGF